jgi:hypothetical protein
VPANGVRPALSQPPTELGRQHWREYLRSLVSEREQLLVAVAVTEAAQPRAADRPLPLHSISYEADEMQVTVWLRGGAELRYLVFAPRSIEVEELGRETVLRVSDATGVQTVFRLLDRAAGDRRAAAVSEELTHNVGGAPMS